MGELEKQEIYPEVPAVTNDFLFHILWALLGRRIWEKEGNRETAGAPISLPFLFASFVFLLGCEKGEKSRGPFGFLHSLLLLFISGEAPQREYEKKEQKGKRV